MRRSLMITIAAAAVVTCGTTAANAATIGAAHLAPALTSSSWGNAKVLPGTAALNKEGLAGVASVSCPSAGNCGAGGRYETLVNKHTDERPFVDSETNGIWGKAIEVPGLSALRTLQYAYISSVSCTSAGNCSAGGYYTNNASGGPRRLFVTTETGGTWGDATAVTGLPQNANPDTFVVSCWAAGYCSAVGDYGSGSDQVQAFVLNQTGGTWGTAEEAPGTATLNTGGKAEATSVSCAAGGDCSAGGFYTDHAGHQQAFVLNETGGTWGTAEEVPGTAALNTNGTARVSAVSCASAGSCSAGGSYYGASGVEVFAVSETGGTWGTAAEVPGIAALNGGGTAELISVSCASAGNCGASGYYYDATTQDYEPFVVSQAGGTWGNAEEVPGLAALDPNGSITFLTVSCGAAGSCNAGGYYNTASNSSQAFVVTETGGTWGNAQNVPAAAENSSVSSVSCVSASHCTAAGSMANSGGLQAMVVSQT
jgi:hypothetical protein